MLEQGEGEEVLFILQGTCFYWLPVEEGGHLQDTMGWMARWVLVGPVAWGDIRPRVEEGELVDSQVSAIMQVPVTTEGLVRVGCHRAVLGQGPRMAKGVVHVLRVG